MQDTYDPFSYLLNEIRAYDTGLREDWGTCQRRHYLDLLLVEEAQEIAWGRRHLTIVHGDAVDEVQAERLDDLFAAWENIATRAEWCRIGGVPDWHLTLTLADPQHEQWIRWAADQAIAINPGHWQLLATALPSLHPMDR